MQRATLILPALLPRGHELAPLPHLPFLQRLLARADRWQACSDPIQFLYQCAGHETIADEDVPAAALTAAADFDTPSTGVLMRADPVHLHADRDRLLLFDAGQLHLQAAEVDALITVVAEFLRAEGIELSRGRALERWYLTLSQAAAITTTALHRVQGRAIAHALPRGPQRQTWVRRCNEIQMLLFDHPVNQARAARGALTINSLWFWGQGQRPSLPKPNPVCQLIGAQVTLDGLASIIGVQQQDELPQSIAGELLIWPQPFSDERVQTDWRIYADSLRQLEREYLQPLYRMLGSGRLEQLRLWTDGQLFTLTPLQRWRLWRRQPYLKG